MSVRRMAEVPAYDISVQRTCGNCPSTHTSISVTRTHGRMSYMSQQGRNLCHQGGGGGSVVGSESNCRSYFLPTVLSALHVRVGGGRKRGIRILFLRLLCANTSPYFRYFLLSWAKDRIPRKRHRERKQPDRRRRFHPPPPPPSLWHARWGRRRRSV